MFFGKRKIINNGLDVATTYHNLAEKNYASANILASNGMYNEAAYLYIQSMEKYTKEQICQKIDPINKYFANMIRDTGHSLDKSLEMLIEIYCGKDVIAKEQIKNFLMNTTLQNTRFEILNNTLRYPRYEFKYGNYTMIELNKKDCETLKQMTLSLKKSLSDLHKMI